QPEDGGPLLWGAIDKSGRYVLEPRFSSLCRFEKGLACAREVVHGQHFRGYINREGKWIFRQPYTPSR
ncbi:MAG: WG repeat-containing protein, partial [Myxococcota bacterium]|nr:WG repeat-containing protein [Myxococcota bacterium]